MRKSSDIRRAFIDFFGSRGHEAVASGSLVPANDPTLMFVNAGMVPFKDVFTGKESRPYKRATSSQKCIRISGKHNDLENVGVTARHHTFFEMLGNFSFGDYFKREAIQHAWDFVTTTMQLAPEQMVVTVFGGAEGIPADDEAARLWADITGYGDERILRCGLKDNFWQMGETGPCGPCSEIHFYLGDGPADPGTFGDEPTPDGRGWFELWNLVFMQFDRGADGTLNELPAPSIDTGMGLERLAVVAQGVASNYDTDLLKPIVTQASEISGKPYRGTQAPDDISMRVIADHARTAAFLIAEGVFPDRDGRAYVLRRVMRRAIRHGHRLGIERPFLHECALSVVDEMKDAYPELQERRSLIADITRQEEERFRATLKRGLDLLVDNQVWTSKDNQRQLPGELAFKLYDTYGFPLDLQRVLGGEQGFAIDEAGFEKALEAARRRSAGSKVGSQAVDAVYQQLAGDIDTTFSGYEQVEDKSEIVALLVDGVQMDKVSAERVSGERVQAGGGKTVEVIAQQTPFYAESGGQVGDTGWIRSEGTEFVVTDTVKPTGKLFVHRGQLKQGRLAVGDTVSLIVDNDERISTRRNHSATHLLHWALRKVLGPQAMQKGSLVGPKRLRFDYSATQPLSREQVLQIEDLVNAAVLANTAITTDLLGMAEAKERGAIGIFEEKYGDVVRMLAIGPSLELCGGTHAARTGDIGLFKVLSESGLAAGVRRLEAATGRNALAHVREAQAELEASAELLKVPVQAVRERTERLLEQQRELSKENERLNQRLASGGTGDLTRQAREMSGVRMLGAVVELRDVNALRELADRLRDKMEPAVVLLGSKLADDKAVLVCSVSKQVTDRYKAGQVVKQAAAIVGGGGGGRPDFAQAGGSDPSRLEEAVASVYALGT